MADNKHKLMETGPEPKRRKESSPIRTPTKGSTSVSRSESHKTEVSSLSTPASRCSEPYTIDPERYASDLDQAILIEGRGQIRTNYPYNEFCESFSSRLQDLKESKEPRIAELSSFAHVCVKEE